MKRNKPLVESRWRGLNLEKSTKDITTIDESIRRIRNYPFRDNTVENFKKEVLVK